MTTEVIETRKGEKLRLRASRLENGRQAVEVVPLEAKLEPSFLPPSPQVQESRVLSLRLLVSSPSWKSRKSSLKSLKAIDAGGFAELAGEMFTELLTACVGFSVREFIPLAASALDVSTETAKRYLQKSTSVISDFALVGGKIEKVQDV